MKENTYRFTGSGQKILVVLGDESSSRTAYWRLPLGYVATIMKDGTSVVNDDDEMFSTFEDLIIDLSSTINSHTGVRL